MYLALCSVFSNVITFCEHKNGVSCLCDVSIVLNVIVEEYGHVLYDLFPYS